MKRDMELIRELLLRTEAAGPHEMVGDRDLEGWDVPVVADHIRQLTEKRYVEALGSHSGYSIHRLTFDGHDYLASISDDAVWAKVKGKITEMGGALPFEVVKALGTAYLKAKLGLEPGE